MSASGTDRLCRPVGKHFGYWRRSGGAAVVPVRTQPKLCKESLGHRYVQSLWGIRCPMVRRVQG